MKKHPEHKIDELLHRSLHNLQGETSAQDWAEIQRRLQQKQNDKPVFWLFKNLKRIGFATLLLVVFACASYFTFQQSIVKISITTNTQQLSSARNNEHNNSENDNNPAQKTATINNENVENNEAENVGQASVNNEINISTRKGNKAIAIKRNAYKTNGSKAVKTTINAANSGTENDGSVENLSGEFKSTNEVSGKDFSANADIDELQNNSPHNNGFSADLTDIKKAENKVDSNHKYVIKTNNKLVKNKNISPNNLQGKFAFGINFTTGSGDRKIATDPSKREQIHKNYYDLRNSQETGSGNFSASIFTQYYIWKGLNLQSGIQYNRQSEKANYKFYNNEIPVIDSATKNILGYIQLQDTIGTSYSGKNTYSYAVVPLQIGYEFPVSARLSFGLKAGGNAMFLANAKGKTLRTDDLSLTDLNNLRKTNFNLNISPAIYYKFKKCFSIGLEMDYSQLLNPLQNQNSTIQTKPWNIGAGVNLRYSPF